MNTKDNKCHLVKKTEFVASKQIAVANATH